MSTPQARRDPRIDTPRAARQTAADWLSCNRCSYANVMLSIQEEFPSHASTR